jgi:hypothetical protein
MMKDVITRFHPALPDLDRVVQHERAIIEPEWPFGIR